MIDTERSLETLARLHAEILRERAEGLHEAALTAKTRLVEREEALARLRAQVTALKTSLARVPPAKTVPATVPASVPAAVRSPAPAPAPVKAPARREASNWRTVAPYAAIAACAVALEFSGAPQPARPAPDLTALVQPAPAAITRAKASAKGAPVALDDDRSQEVLLLVHEWKLPGDEKSLGERLGGELDLPGGRPSWRVERTGPHDYRVTFQAAQNDLPYAFEADIETRVVWPTAETQALLAPRFTAAFRDAAR